MPPEYVLDKSPEWILWAYKSVARADRERFAELTAALFGTGGQAAPATTDALARAGIGGVNE